MAELKTKETKASVSGFLKQIPDEKRRKDAEKILAMMQSVTKEQPKMWGSSIIGFGRLHYRRRLGARRGLVQGRVLAAEGCVHALPCGPADSHRTPI